MNIPVSFHLALVVSEKEMLSYHDNGIKAMITGHLDIQQNKQTNKQKHYVNLDIIILFALTTVNKYCMHISKIS